MIDNAKDMGEFLVAGLTQLATKYDCVSLPRGKGLMVAIDLLDSKGNLDSTLRDRIVDGAFYKGLLLLGCGKAAIRFCPPLVIDSAQIQVVLQILSDLLAEIL